jgi:hypothetical protein
MKLMSPSFFSRGAVIDVVQQQNVERREILDAGGRHARARPSD